MYALIYCGLCNLHIIEWLAFEMSNGQTATDKPLRKWALHYMNVESVTELVGDN